MVHRHRRARRRVRVPRALRRHLDRTRADLALRQAERAKVLQRLEEEQNLLASTRPEAARARKAIAAEIGIRDRAQSRENRIYFIVGIALSIPIGIIINLLTG